MLANAIFARERSSLEIAREVAKSRERDSENLILSKIALGLHSVAQASLLMAFNYLIIGQNAPRGRVT